MTDPETQKTIDTYLAALRKQLRELMEEDATDIVDEIRAHILDKTPQRKSPPLSQPSARPRSSPAATAPRSCSGALNSRARPW